MNGTMRQIPSSSDLTELARATASRCGVDVSVAGGRRGDHLAGQR